MSGIESVAVAKAGLAASSALSARINKILDLLLEKAPAFVSEKFKNGQMIINKGLPTYLEANYAKCETLRTLLRRDAPVLLDDVYVEPKFSIESDEVTSDDLLRRNSLDGCPLLVTGTAGSGKSVFLKWCFRQSIVKGHTYYPVFFELRSMGNDASSNLLDSIYQSISDYAEGFTKAQFNFGLRKGLFYLMIDALDEAPIEVRESIEKDIIEITRKHPKCPLILTSRPSNDLKSWEGFTEAHLLPFDRTGCIDYIRKIDFDESRKSDFLTALTADFFVKHSEFLSNALLAAMMLLTFDEFGEIPERRHIFYQKCFDVLIREHDQSKGRYRRKLVSGLDHSQVETLFQSFCALSYLEGKYNFTSKTLIEYLEDALEFCGLQADIDAVAEDFCNSVSIIQQDGDHYEFVHRSFQEYFYAKFCLSDRSYTLVDKALEVASRIDSKGMLDMIADMNSSYFHTELIMPIVDAILKKTSGTSPTDKPDMVLKLFCDSVGYSPADEVPGLYTFFLSTSAGNVAYKQLNSYVLFYINNNLHKHYQEFKAQIEWPDLLNNDEIREMTSTASHSERRDSGIDVPLSHRNRATLSKMKADILAESIISSLEITSQYMKEDLKKKANSLSNRMRSRGKSR